MGDVEGAAAGLGGTSTAEDVQWGPQQQPRLPLDPESTGLPLLSLEQSWALVVNDFTVWVPSCPTSLRLRMG